MKKADKEEITRVLCEAYPEMQVHLINSALVSAQNRKRLYWTNIPDITQPEDKDILLCDILEDIPFDDPRWKPLDGKYLTDKAKLELKGKAYSLTTVQTDSEVFAVLGSFSIYNQNLATEKSTTLGSNSHCPTAKTGQIIV